MSRSNLCPIMTLADGTHLVVSTQSLQQGDFTCTLYNATFGQGDDATFRIVSSHMTAPTCLAAQEHAYQYALRIYPMAGSNMRKPPYLVWRGPQPDLQS